MSSPASKSPEQSDKSKKYDRQIRLWGEHGQVMLETSKVCLVNATAVGCEALKSLILPGIGSFTIIDGDSVTEDDLGINFFLDSTFQSQPKATACMQLLKELNPDVRGDSVEESVDYILANRPAFFDDFDIVLASNLNEKTLLQLSDYLWNINVPLIYCRSLGLFGAIRLQIREHCVVEAHPDNKQHDLRLEHPFPTLQKHLENTPVTSKVPWLLVVFKYLQQWQEEHGGRFPKTFKEKNQLRDMIRGGMTAEEENFEEAIKAVNTCFGGGNVPNSIKTIFNDNACLHLTKESDPFWIMLKALKNFVENENNGLLPLPGVLPDMTAETDAYITLQTIYRQQALQDADNVYRKCQAYLKELDLPAEYIDNRAVRLFCREAAYLSVIRGTKISDEHEKGSRVQSLDFEALPNFAEQYVALRAYERFLTECGNIPGVYYVENDVPRFKSIVTKMLLDWGAHAAINDDMIHEICRYGGAELHSVSAYIGGCAAHEVIKILTKQYKPIDNTFLYNAITSETETIKL